MSKTLAIEMNDDVFPALQEEPEQMVQEMRLFSAVKWYELGSRESEQGCGNSRDESDSFHNSTLGVWRFPLPGDRRRNQKGAEGIK